MIDVEYRLGEIYLARIEIHPDHQGSGIGTRLISALVDEARKDGQDVGLDVLFNRRAARMLAGQAMSHVGRASGREPARGKC
jgi:GNAT superfamily N-acetyltransferase